MDAIGYKGIGFKTVFLDNDYVYLSTGKYSFRFDKTATDVINTPWQILPIWTEPDEISDSIQGIFSQHPNDLFRVKFALKPRDRKILTDRDRSDNYIDLFCSVFETERVILFIPNIQKVSVFLGGISIPAIVREKDNSNWCVSELEPVVVPEPIRERINDVLTNQDADKSKSILTFTRRRLSLLVKGKGESYCLWKKPFCIATFRLKEPTGGLVF